MVTEQKRGEPAQRYNGFDFNEEEDEEEEEEEDFDANELLNLTDYQNKRKGVVKKKDSDQFEDDWGDDWAAPPKKQENYKDLEEFDYHNTDLNKLSDAQLARHKQKMELDF
mmetsp:Transcript_27498/g.20662  ORF Transcript_27498/g.20662 Transcript_27498/m.20662 type:complete len:111 (+) Transcript_27498:485-817(+)